MSTDQRPWGRDTPLHPLPPLHPPPISQLWTPPCLRRSPSSRSVRPHPLHPERDIEWGWSGICSPGPDPTPRAWRACSYGSRSGVLRSSGLRHRVMHAVHRPPLGCPGAPSLFACSPHPPSSRDCFGPRCPVPGMLLAGQGSCLTRLVILAR